MPAPIPQDSESLGTSRHFVFYPGAVVDEDLVAEGLAPCRRIRAGGAGDLVVRRASDGALVTLTFKAGEVQKVSCTALIGTGSTATDVSVFW